MTTRAPLILAIESSCDETAVALYSKADGILANEVYSQIELHRQHGGVVPELAARDHLRRLPLVLQQALERADKTLQDIELIAYTAGPGLLGALMTGAGYARALAYALGIPAIAIHHMEGHLLSPLLAEAQPEVPFVALLVSGGHTQLMAVDAPGKYRLLGQTLDDAVGEAFDKTAKLMGLPYPGGPELAALAEQCACSLKNASKNRATTRKPVPTLPPPSSKPSSKHWPSNAAVPGKKPATATWSSPVASAPTACCARPCNKKPKNSGGACTSRRSPSAATTP